MKRPRVPDGVRAGSVIYVFLGLAFGGGASWTLAFFADHGSLPTIFFGIRSMGGPFEELGPEAFIALGVLLVAISLIDVAVGVLLWRGRRLGAWIGLATDPIAFGLGLGFALPLLLIGVPIRAMSVLLTWDRLR